jgi:hypothetical protein
MATTLPYPFTTRPVITGSRGVVAAGHYLAAEIGSRILDKGGTAIDAGVAAGFVLNVVKPHDNGTGGEAPLLAHRPGAKRGRRLASINGQGVAPQAATVEWFRARHIDPIPGDGLLSATVPAAFGACATALMAYGTLTLADVLGPAIEIAEDGFAVDDVLYQHLVDYLPRHHEEWPSTAATIGEPDAPPTRTGPSLVDLAGGYVAALALLAGLWRSRWERVGCDCDISLRQTALSLLSYVATWAATEGYVPPRRRNSAHPSIVPFPKFQTTDSWIVVACPQHTQWERLCRAVGRDELLRDPRYTDLNARNEHRIFRYWRTSRTHSARKQGSTGSNASNGPMFSRTCRSVPGQAGRPTTTSGSTRFDLSGRRCVCRDRARHASAHRGVVSAPRAYWRLCAESATRSARNSR